MMHNESDFIDSLCENIFVSHGEVRDVDINLYAVVRDEMFFLPALFEHYRRLGVQQFLVFDDMSVDGTADFLRAQPDCVVLGSSKRFGQVFEVTYPDGRKAKHRWGKILKSLIPRKFLMGKFAIYVDADEFIIPPRQKSLCDIIAWMRDRGNTSLSASLIEFYPQGVEELEGELRATDSRQLFESYPFFDAAPLMTIGEDGWPKRIAGSASERLFKEYGLARSSIFSKIFSATGRGAIPKTSTPTRKTPIAFWGADSWLLNSHIMNTPPAPDAFLAIAHFKFTHATLQKINRARVWKSHAKQGIKYDAYAALFERLAVSHGRFASECSRRFSGSEQLEEIGLICWPRN